MAPKKDNESGSYGRGGGDLAYMLGAQKKFKDMRKLFKMFQEKGGRSDRSDTSDSDRRPSSGQIAKRVLKEIRRQGGLL